VVELRLQLLYHAVEGGVGYRDRHLGKEDQELVQGHKAVALLAKTRQAGRKLKGRNTDIELIKAVQGCERRDRVHELLE
jgi:hypothetical protein